MSTRTQIRYVRLGAERIAAFWSRFEKQKNGCWRWVGASCGSTVRYGSIVLSNPRRCLMTHRLAWILTYGPIPEGKQVLHSCDFGLCGNPKHLFIGTQMDNVDDMIAKGRHTTIKAFVDAVLTDSDVVRIFAYFNADVSVETLAKRFGVVPSTINRVLRGEIWTRNLKELGLEPIKRGKGNYATNHHGNPGTSNPRAKLTDVKVIQIRELHEKGVAQNALARQFSMSKMTVSNIVTGKSWKHLLSQTGGQ